MKETFILSTYALNAALACLSEHDLDALHTMKEKFNDGADALDAIRVCLSKHDLDALRNKGVSWLFSPEPKLNQLHGIGKLEICHALTLERVPAASQQWRI